MNYENRVVAFIDILGFRALLDETVAKNGTDDPGKINDIIKAYNSIRDIWNLDNTSEFHKSFPILTSKKVTIFSDSIVVSFKAEEPSEVFQTLLEIKTLIMGLLDQQILCRGAVAMGKLIHQDQYIFGPALVEAHLLETKAAIYPRVILDRNIVDAGTKYRSQGHTPSEEREYVESLLEKDSDGMYYIDYFFKAHRELNDSEYDFPAYINNLGTIIRNGLMSSTSHSKADVRIKYSWMRERYNRMVEIVTNKRVIQGIERSGDASLADFFSELKKISPGKH